MAHLIVVITQMKLIVKATFIQPQNVCVIFLVLLDFFRIPSVNPYFEKNCNPRPFFWSVAVALSDLQKYVDPTQ